MQTKFLLKAKKFFIETFGDGKYPTKDEMVNKLLFSNFIPFNPKIMISIFYTSDKFQEINSKILKPYGITIPQMEIMKVLYFAKSSTLNQDDIGQYTFASKANISSHLVKLENKNIVNRKEDPKNKRQKIVILTKKGEDLLIEIIENLNPIEMKNILPKEEALELIRLLTKVRENMSNFTSNLEKKE